MVPIISHTCEVSFLFSIQFLQWSVIHLFVFFYLQLPYVRSSCLILCFNKCFDFVLFWFRTIHMIFISPFCKSRAIAATVFVFKSIYKTGWSRIGRKWRWRRRSQFSYLVLIRHFHITFVRIWKLDNRFIREKGRKDFVNEDDKLEWIRIMSPFAVYLFFSTTTKWTRGFGFWFLFFFCCESYKKGMCMSL